MKEKEKEKYKKVWSNWQYRKISPAQRESWLFINKFLPDSSIIDFGCGTGRLSLELSEKGHTVTMLDITESSLDQHVRESIGFNLKFKEACLWDDLDFNLKYNHSMCIDVLEHIPETKLDLCLENIKKYTQYTSILSIACFDDTWFNEKLHLTVKPPEWWLDKLNKYWVYIKELENINNKKVTYEVSNVKDIINRR